jgi:hypothetical protein
MPCLHSSTAVHLSHPEAAVRPAERDVRLGVIEGCGNLGGKVDVDRHQPRRRTVLRPHEGHYLHPGQLGEHPGYRWPTGNAGDRPEIPQSPILATDRIGTRRRLRTDACWVVVLVVRKPRDQGGRVRDVGRVARRVRGAPHCAPQVANDGDFRLPGRRGC